MMKRSFLTLFVIALWLGAGCSAPSTTPPDDNKDSDVTDNDLTGDGSSDISSDGIVDPDSEDGTTIDEIDEIDDEKDADVLCDECDEGQIKCDGDNKYWTCVLTDGCYKWADKSLCPTSETCVCLEAGEEVCVPTGSACDCVPDCDGKECGYDGCGAYCGDGLPDLLGCNEGFRCEENTCIADTDPCESECNDGESICNGAKIVFCVDINAADTDKDACWKFQNIQDCGENQSCQFDECTCDFGGCGTECCASDEYVCFAESCCLPDCDGKECGSDGCGGTCGSCSGDTPICQSGVCILECIDDCVEGEQQCTSTNKAYSTCVEIQTDCWKWSDVAFACGPNELCDSDQDDQCVCLPDCGAKQCGPDGCGGSCGSCPLGTQCGEDDGMCFCNDQAPDYVCDLTTDTTYLNACEATLAGVATFQKGECPDCMQLCTDDELTPQQICGVDQNTYSNFCQLKCTIGSDTCYDYLDCPQIEYPGACIPDIAPGCNIKYAPVCADIAAGTITYYNHCDYSSKAETDNATFYCSGACFNADLCSQCDDTCEPVCGLLGDNTRKTYMNQCLLECEGASFLEDGACCTDCDDVEEWVCSDQFHSFLNSCYLTCKAPEETPLMYEIPIAPNGDVLFDICETCHCDLSAANYAPVCGSDWVSYYNDCALNCMTDVEVECNDACGFDTCPCPVTTGGYAIASEIADPPNPADSLQRGVCGADGRTYGNICSAVYMGTYVVQETWCATCAAQCAGSPYDPYCCDDGVTYPSICIAEKCNSLINPALCSKGKCCVTAEECDDSNPETTDQCNTQGVCENI